MCWLVMDYPMNDIVRFWSKKKIGVDKKNSF